MIPRCQTGAVIFPNNLEISTKALDTDEMGRVRETYLPFGTTGSLSTKVGRFLDVCSFGDVYRLVSEKAGGKYGQSNERRVLLVESKGVRRERQLRNVKFLVTKLAEEASKEGAHQRI
jgi:hypothetical protein